MGDYNFKIRQTALFKKEKKGKMRKGLKEVLEIEIESKISHSGILTLLNEKFEMNISKGKNIYKVEIPEIEEEKEIDVVLSIDEEIAKKKVRLKPQRKWKIYLVHFSHTDPAYTDLPSRIKKKHTKFFDMVLDFCKETDSYPEESKFRWNIETSYQLQNYLRHTSKEKKEKLVQLIKKGRIELSPLYLAHTSELFDNEILIRDTYFAHNFCKENGLEMKCAMSSDVTGQPWALPMILSSYGIKYLSTAVYPTRAKTLKVERPFYWKSPDGSGVLVWDTDPKNTYAEGWAVGFENSYDEVLDKLPRYLKRFEDENYPYDGLALRLMGYLGDNTPPNIEVSKIARKWNETFEYPKIIVSVASQFFDYMSQKYEKKFPEYRLAWPDWWVDTLGSVAFETGASRRTHTNFENAEKLLAIVKYMDPAFKFPNEYIKEICEDLLIADELSTASAFAVYQPYTLQAKGQSAELAAFTYRAAINSEELLELGINSLFSKIRISEDNTVVVFNSLPWERTDVTSVPLAKGNFKLLDFEGKEIPSQIVGNVCEWKEAPYQMEGKKLIFVADKVPPLGYKLYRLVPAEEEKVEQKEEEKEELENDFFRIKAHKKGVTIYDKSLNKLVNGDDFLFNQFIYEETEEDRPEWKEPEVDLEDIDLDFMKYARETQVSLFPTTQTRFKRNTPEFRCKISVEPVRSSLILESSTDVFPKIEQEIVIYRNIKRIEIINRVNKKNVMKPESLYYAFPFNLEKFETHFECANSIMRPEKDQLPGSCRDWFLIQRWIDMSNDDFGVVLSPLEAPLVQLGEINTGKWLDKLEIKKANIFSWPMNNYWFTNIPPCQGGEFEFRYALTTHEGGYNPVEATKFGHNFHFPLICKILNKQPNGCLPERTFSFLRLEEENVIITSIKKSEDSLIIRLLEIEGKDCSANLTITLEHGFDAHLTNIGEDVIGELEVSENKIRVPIKGHGIRTVKISHKS